MDNNQQPASLDERPINSQPQPNPTVFTPPMMVTPNPVPPIAPPPKNKKLLIIILVSVVILLITGVIVTIILLSAPKNTVDNTKKAADTSKTKKIVSSAEQIVGNSDIGYVTVPKTWVPFSDVSNPSGFAYCDGTEDQVVTMSASDTATSAQSTATAISQYISDAGAKDVTHATVTLGKYNAYQNYAYYEDVNKVLVTWSFNDENGKLHYISI